MKTELAVDGTRFFINDRPTYEGVTFEGSPVEGLLMNSRMVQAVFDDENPETAVNWRYPDTGRWDADRNTDAFCASLAEYRAHGLLAVTVGLQGGGAIYTPDVYASYVCSAYGNDGSFKRPFFDRLLRVIHAADELGMVVIVNYFYWQHVNRIANETGDEAAVKSIIERVTAWLLDTGYRNIIADVVNESHGRYACPLLRREGIADAIEIAKGVTLDAGRRLIVGSSTGGGDAIPQGRWLEAEDVSMPHGNGTTPDRLRAKLKRLKDDPVFRKRPRPVLINEDSIFTENMDAAVGEYASWGFYCQGYGSQYQDRMNWKTRGRETKYEDLSGYQTPPVNWGVNTPVKRAFFERLREITQGR